jgi:hypothetical protein
LDLAIGETNDKHTTVERSGEKLAKLGQHGW